MINTKYIVGIILLVGLVGYATGRYAQPAKVVTQIKEVTKTIEVVKHNTTTITHEHKNPDGSTDTDTTVTNHDIDLSKSASSTEISKIVTNVKPQWKAQATAGYDFSRLQPVYGADVERRIIGPIFVGAWGNNDHTAGLSVSLEF